MLHPELYAHINQIQNKLQRQVDTFLLKSQEPKNQPGQPSQTSDQKIKTLERVNKEMKKQLECYKEEIGQIKKTEGFINMENY